MFSQQTSSETYGIRERGLGVEAAFIKPSWSEYSLSIGVSLALNFFFCWAFLSSSFKDDPIEEPPLEDIQWVALTALGEPPPPNAVPRIVAPPPPPPPEAEEISLSRTLEPVKEKIEKEKPKTEPKTQKKTKTPDQKRATPKKQKDVTLNSLFGDHSDVRADRGPRKGDRRGHQEGTSSQFQESREMSIYVSTVSRTINRRLKLPNTISPRQLKKLKAEIYIKLGSNRKIKGSPTWVKRSGNRFFDEAAMKAVMAFSIDQDGKLPLPKEPEIKRHVFQKGLLLLISPND